MNIDSCCKDLHAGDSSPFDIIALGWHDGILNGMARCRSCDCSYYFDMLAWDSDRDVRVYGLKLVSANSYAAVGALISELPPQVAQLQSSLDQIALRVRDSLASGFEWNLYIASADISRTILAARTIGYEDWISILR